MLEQIISNLIGVSIDNPFVTMISFFIEDFTKIILLLFVMVFVIGYLRTYVSEKIIRKKLAKKGFLKYVTASGFGTITPFCSCSSIPLFVSFVEAGVPLGVTFSFLATSPLVNEFIVALMIGLFGWKITAIYVISGMLIGIISGIIIDKMNLEKYLIKKPVNKCCNKKVVEVLNFKNRILFGFNEAKDMIFKLWIYIAIGIGIGALIHNFVPTSTIENLMVTLGVLGVPVATILGIPMYGNGSAILPVALELFNKGVPLGTALAFMMSIVALSLPEAIILKKIMKPKLIGIYFAIVGLGIIIIGYLFNILQFIL